MKWACGKPFPQLNLIRCCYRLEWFWASFVLSLFVCVWQRCKSAFVCKYGRNMLCNDHKPHMWPSLCICVRESNLIKMMFSRLTSHFHNAVLTSISHWRDSSCRTACFFKWFLLFFPLPLQPSSTSSEGPWTFCADFHQFPPPRIPPNKLRSLLFASTLGPLTLHHGSCCVVCAIIKSTVRARRNTCVEDFAVGRLYL